MIRGAALCVLLAGCLDALGPTVGAEQFNTCVNSDSNPDVAISFERDIRLGIMNRPDIHCVKCHDPTSPTPFGVVIGGLDMTSYATFMRGGVHSATTIAIPGDPCDSTVVEKLGPTPPFGVRMPKDGPPYLSAEDAQTIIDWIAEGAHDN